MLNALRRENHILPALVLFLGILSTSLALSLHPWLGTIVALVSVVLVYLEIVTQLSFRAPPKRKPPVEDERFSRSMLAVNDQEVAHYIAEGREGAPLAWIFHGWTGGACRMTFRAESFLERGWSVVLVDLPGHGASDSLTKWSAEESCTLLIQCVNQLAQQKPELFTSGVVHYGHSIGAFIGLRISHRRDELNEAVSMLGWILESPMTGYTEIFDETCNLLKIPKIFRPTVLKKTLRHFNAINQNTANFSRLDEADVPKWGMPQESSLLVQANPDERLGAVHHERLIALMTGGSEESLLTIALLDDLTHSGSHNSSSRKAAVDAWLDESFPTHSSS